MWVAHGDACAQARAHVHAQAFFRASLSSIVVLCIEHSLPGGAQETVVPIAWTVGCITFDLPLYVTAHGDECAHALLHGGRPVQGEKRLCLRSTVDLKVELLYGVRSEGDIAGVSRDWWKVQRADTELVSVNAAYA